MYVAEQFNRFDVRVFRVLCDDRIIAFFVDHRERQLQSDRVEFISVDGTGVGRHDDQILRFTGQVDDLAQFADDLVARVQVFKIDGAERVDDFSRMDVERNDPRYAEPFVDMAEHTRSQAFASLFFVLAAVGVGGYDERNGCSSGLPHRVDRHEHGHDVIVHGKDGFVRAVVQRKLFVIFYVLEDIDVFSAYRFEQFGFEFAVCKKRKARGDFKRRCPIFRHIAFDVEFGRVDIVFEIDFFDEIVFAHFVAFRNDIVFKRKTMLVHVLQMRNHFVGETFSARTCNDGQVHRFGIRHDSRPLFRDFMRGFHSIIFFAM